MIIRLTAIISPDEEGKWLGRCPELGVYDDGTSPEDAFENLKKAVDATLKAAGKAGRLAELRRMLEEKRDPRAACLSELNSDDWLRPMEQELAPA